MFVVENIDDSIWVEVRIAHIVYSIEFNQFSSVQFSPFNAI